jgi:hypothetical protein
MDVHSVYLQTGQVHICFFERMAGTNGSPLGKSLAAVTPNRKHCHLLVQDNTKNRAIYLQPAAIVDEANLSELVHEEIHS